MCKVAQKLHSRSYFEKEFKEGQETFSKSKR